MTSSRHANTPEFVRCIIPCQEARAYQVARFVTSNQAGAKPWLINGFLSYNNQVVTFLMLHARPTTYFMQPNSMPADSLCNCAQSVNIGLSGEFVQLGRHMIASFVLLIIGHGGIHGTVKEYHHHVWSYSRILRLHQVVLLLNACHFQIQYNYTCTYTPLVE